MSNYTMAQIVTLTGIKSHTLRKWETRYSFLVPERTDTNIRYYSDEQLKKLLNINILNRNGYRISKIDKMSNDEIYEIISNKLIAGDIRDEIDSLIISMINLDEKTFDNLLKTQIIKKGLLATTTEIIYPFLHQVGVLWGINKVMPAQEHFISNLIKKRFLSIIDAMPHPRENASKIIMFLPENEYHEIGLLLAYYIAREIGWKVYYLGQNVPTDNLTEVIDKVKPNALLAMFVTPATSRLSDMIDNILSQGHVKLYVSGNPDNFSKFLSNSEVTYLLNPNDLIKELEKFQKD